jgi:hypothetical protein
MRPTLEIEQGETLSMDDARPILERVDVLPWAELLPSVKDFGFAVTPSLLSLEERVYLRGLYAHDASFRSHIIMERLRFGVGDYKYFASPLPPIVSELRTHTYPHLAGLANEWAEALAETTRFPEAHATFLDQCHRAGQKRPTPLLLHYERGGYNCLHQDIYGKVTFPLQMVILLGQPGRDWQGGEFVLVEQRPRAQSKAEVIAADQGCAIIFTTRYRPVQGSRGYYRVTMKHGVARVRRGSRYTLGIIFHDAE